MKKFTNVFLMLLVLSALIVMSCAQPAQAPSPSSTPAPATPIKPTTLRYTSANPIVHYSTDNMNMFAEKVKAKTNGQVIIEVYPGGKLFQHEQAPDAIRTGAVDIAMNANDHCLGYIPALAWTTYPYMAISAEQFFKVVPKLKEIDSLLFKQKLNAKLLYYTRYTDIGINTKIPVQVPNDLKGLRVRVPTSAFADSVSAWGASSMAINAAEVYNAFAKGSLDAVLTSGSMVEARQYYEVAKYFIRPLSWSFYMAYMNLDSWNALSKQNQTAIEDVIKEMEPITWKQISQDLLETDNLLKQKITLKVLTPAEIKQWGDLTVSAYEKFKAEMKTKGYGEPLQQIEQLVSSVK